MYLPACLGFCCVGCNRDLTFTLHFHSHTLSLSYSLSLTVSLALGSQPPRVLVLQCLRLTTPFLSSSFCGLSLGPSVAIGLDLGFDLKPPQKEKKTCFQTWLIPSHPLKYKGPSPFGGCSLQSSRHVSLSQTLFDQCNRNPHIQSHFSLAMWSAFFLLALTNPKALSSASAR